MLHINLFVYRWCYIILAIDSVIKTIHTKMFYFKVELLSKAVWMTIMDRIKLWCTQRPIV